MTESAIEASDPRARLRLAVRAYRETPWYWLAADLALYLLGYVLDVLLRVGIVAMGVSLAMWAIADAAHATPGGYTFCAGEGETCTLPSHGLIIYGADSSTDATIPTAMYGTALDVNVTGGYSFICSGATPGLSDAAPGYHKACWYLLDTGPASAPEGGASSPGNIDWSNASHLAQAGMVVALCFAVFMGYRAGDKT